MAPTSNAPPHASAVSLALALTLTLTLTLAAPAAARGKRSKRSKRAKQSVLLLDASRARVDPQLRRQAIDNLATALESKQGLISLRLPRRADTSAAEIDDLLARSRAHSEQFREQQARQALIKAEGVFRASATITVAPLVKILLARARLHSDLGDMLAARADLARLIALAPNHILDPGVFSPGLVKAHRKLRRKRKRKRGTIHVVTAPPGAEVWVDGRRRGRAPLSVAVVAGEHFVAAGPEGGRADSTVTVVQGDAKPVNLKLPRHRPPDDAALRAIGKRARARWVAAVTLAQPLNGAQRFRLEVRLISSRTIDLPRQLASKEVSAARLTRATSALALRMRAAMEPAPPRVVASSPSSTSAPLAGPPPVTSPADQGGSIFKTWWFWTAVVAVVGGGTAAAVVLTREDDPGVRLRLER